MLMEMAPKSAARRNIVRYGLWNCFVCTVNRKRVSAEEQVMAIQGAGKVISREEDGNGVVRVRVVMSKKELKQMVAAIKSDDSTGGGGHRRSTTTTTTTTTLAGQSLEQSLHVLRRRHMKRVQSMNGRQGGWMPALQSIPEEV